MLPDEPEEPLLSAGLKSSNNSSRRPRLRHRSAEQSTAAEATTNRSKLKGCDGRESTSNTSTQPNRSSLLSTAVRRSQLIENFSEFLASRNVINRYSRYDKIVNSGQQHPHGQRHQQTSAILPTGAPVDDTSGNPGGLVLGQQAFIARDNLLVGQPVRFLANHSGHLCCHQPSGISKLASAGTTPSMMGSGRGSHFACCGSCCCKKKARQPLVLLRALLSRKHKNKTSLLLGLLRAPIVLAALFSLLLALSLLVLYTMSFLHNYNRQHYQTAALVTSGHTHSGQYGHAHPGCQENRLEGVAADREGGRLQQWLGRQPEQSLEANVVIGKTTSTMNESGVASSSSHVNSRRHLKPRVAFKAAPVDGDDFNDDSEPPVSSPSALEQWAAVEVPFTIGATDTSSAAASKKASHPASSEPNSSTSSLLRTLTVQTECGALVGVLEAGTIVYRGIAYASPPVGRRRWTRPRPIWLDENLCKPNKTLATSDSAARPKPYCAQLSPVTRRFSGHEDCLYLDVYSPQLDQIKKLPVMVYIHGGFLAFGSSGQGQVNWMKARPSAKLASELNVVLVAFNYRLQALGFMTLLQLAQNNGADGSEGNYGLWDQLAALNWIKRNIESFGGDPNNIVLFGPDSASALPLALMSRSIEAGGRSAASLASPAAASLALAAASELTAAKPTSVAASRTTNANQAQEAGAQEEAAVATSMATLYSRDLFRAAWLTNPTVYYELPYELASLHYQRLFLNQSPCSGFGSTNNHSERRRSSSSSGGSNFARAASNSASNDEVAAAESASRKAARQQADQTRECLMGLSSEQVVRHYFGKDDPAYRLDDQNSLPIHGIFADQFVTVDRELVHDSYPFEGASISSSGLRSTETATQTANASAAVAVGTASASNIDCGSNSSEANQNAGPIVQEGAAHYQAAKTVGRATASAARLANGPVRDKETSSGSGSNYDDNCAGPICAPAISALNQAAASSAGKMDSLVLFEGKDLLLGSTAQAVEYWPCPRNLNQWSWQDFERYVATSLNSFIMDTYKRASELYQVPRQQQATTTNTTGVLQEPSKATLPTANPKETYLSMVSDIRQICPINELAASMQARKHRVQRYVVETRPESQNWRRNQLHKRKAATLEKRRRRRKRDIATPIRSPSPFSSPLIDVQNETAYDDGREPTPEEPASDEDVASASLLVAGDERQILPEFAFHTWDLIAFFGFEFEPEFEPSARDLEFQSKIRQMIMSFVHRSSPPESGGNVNGGYSGSVDKRVNSSDTRTNEPLPPEPAVKEEGASSSELAAGYTLFSQDGSRRQVRGSAYKSEECEFWYKHLGRSYAWVS